LNDSESNRKHFDYLNTHSNILVYCFNDGYSVNKSLYEFTEFLISKYPEPSSFEKKEFAELESPVFPKIQEANKYSATIIEGINDSGFKNNTKVDIFHDVVYDYKLGVIKKYIDEKSALTKFEKNISDIEEEEIEVLTHYNGGKLEKEWEWVKDISIVYTFINDNKELNERYELFKLKYSLLSINKYLPWHKGKIHIITSRDLIEKSTVLLNKDNIELIEAESLLPSNVKNGGQLIEMYLDEIPDITEKFIYMKNSHYFINYIHPRFFFDENYCPKYAINRKRPSKYFKENENKNNDYKRTTELIKDYFGEKAYKGERYLSSFPIPLYRDLIEPVRNLYKKELNEVLKGKNNRKKKGSLLPLYLLVTYNIYGTENPFYPEYVSGFGKIRKAEPPTLNSERTVDLYSFSLLSPEVEDKITFINRLFKDGYYDESLFETVKETDKLFFSVEPEDLSLDNVYDYVMLLKYIYK